MRNKRKKIGFVIGKLSAGGAERVISTLSNEFIERFDVTIITLEDSSVPFYPLDNKVRVVYCYKHIKQPKGAIDSIKLNYNLIKRISQISKKEKIDLLIGFITSANIITTIAAKINRIPCIISERNNPLMNNVPRPWVILRKLIYPLADSLVLQTNGVKKFYEKKGKSKNITILPNPISSDLSKLRNPDIEKEKIILSVGRLIESKCHEDLIKAFHSINPKGWRVIIVGNGPEKEKLSKLIAHYKLTDRIEILSKIKNIEDYYNKSSIFVFTSETEGFPNALLEAMHYGLPCISSDCNFGPSDLITDGINGYLIPVSDTDQLTSRLSHLINDENLQLQFSKNAKTTTEKYISSNVAKQWEKLINTVINKYD